MPLPLLLLAGAGLAGTAGLRKLGQGVGHFGDAKTIAERAKQLGEATKRHMDASDAHFSAVAAHFAEHRQNVQTVSLVRFAQLYERQEARMNLTDKEFAVRFHMPEASFKEIKQTAHLVLNLTNAAMTAGSVGIGAAQGAGVLVGTVGAASTGTAISGLSGAAATNATLAWLGGGSLAAGGGGMALGTVVLGGLAAAPALVVAGFTVAKKGEQALTAAHEFEAGVKEFRAQVSLRMALQQAVISRMRELHSVLERTRFRLDQAVALCEQQERQGTLSDSQFEQALLLAQSVSALLKINVLEPAQYPDKTAQPSTSAAPPAQSSPQVPARTVQESDHDDATWFDDILVVELTDERVNSALYTPDGSILANTGRQLALWPMDDEQLEAVTLDFYAGDIKHLEAHPTDDLYCCARGRSPLLILEDLQEETIIHSELELDGVSVIGTQFISDDHLLVVGEHQVMLIDTDDGDTLWSWSTPDQNVRRFALHPGGQLLALASLDNEIHLLSLPKGKKVRTFRHDGWCNDVTFSPDGRFLLSASEDRTARLWSVETGLELHRFEFSGRYADRVSFSPEGEMLAVGFANGMVGIWETEDGHLLNLFPASAGRITALQFLEDAWGLIAGGESGLSLCFPDKEHISAHEA
ncbi:hypothetical protein [Deinococcus sp. LM3]|uniref:WD40 repeat domain-containing protein n=1 Tax=Deinococcus sp. LM3 TaxID=1938608 RepID=UPI000993C7B3|nr:hypothetical protein [Deinococcus sp. LM3]OOV11992.1 hypothetical protein BXU09_18770 [Deinococcus sp. LM3]